MKIKELIQELKKLNPENEILISGDPEGNDYRTVDFVINDFNADWVDTKYAIIYPTDTLVDLN